LGGFLASKGIAQIATAIDWRGYGQPQYAVVWEMAPAPRHVLDSKKYPLNPGDSIHSEVRYIGNNQFVLTISDATKGWSFTTTQTQPQKYVDLTTAEWIVEAPNGALTNFGTVAFSGCTANNNSISSGPTIHRVTMWVSPTNQTVRALPTNLSNNGSAFSLQWKSN
jgi:hypothetical protein